MMKLAILLVVGVIAKQAYGDEPEAIVGGTLATKGQFPHQISLQMYGQHICGGSIIDERNILCAAHCVESQRDYPYLSIVTGTLRAVGGDGIRHNIKCIRLHPGYTGKSTDGWKDDIAVITLQNPIIFSSVQKPIALASRDYTIEGSRGMTSGWGKTNVNSGTATHLLWIPVNVLNRSQCLAAHPKNQWGGAFTNPNHVCTFEGKGKGACQGDSGGPLVVNNELVGVTSWVAPCALGIADVFTGVFPYKSWIQQTKNTC